MKLYNLASITTPRLIIRPVQLGDEVPLNHAIHNTLDLLQQWQPWAQDPSLAITKGFVQRGVFAWDSGLVADFPMVVLLRQDQSQDQKIIGASGYNDRSDPEQGLYEIGYWLDADYQGQGLVTEYVNALTRYALTQLAAKQVVISTLVENNKSIAVAERLHFSCAGRKQRDPLDVVPGKQRQDFIYTCSCVDALPPLPVMQVNHHQHTASRDIATSIAWAQSLSPEIKVDLAQSQTLVKVPWSTVMELHTGDAPLYLKQTPGDLFIETKVLGLLRDSCQVTAVPELVTQNTALNCFIMKKCGDITLRDKFAGQLQLEILQQGIEVYKTVQQATVPHIERFIDAGVPDWRLNRLPDLYQQLIASPQYLSQQGLSVQQQQKLQSYVASVKRLCAELSRFGVSECLNHSDIHDNNMLYDSVHQSVSIIDWGESTICHPWFSQLACLGAAKHRYSLDQHAADYDSLQQTAYAGWLASPESFPRELHIVTRLLPLYLLLTQKRFLDAIDLPYNADDALSVKQHQRIKRGFVWFIENMEQDNDKTTA